MTGVTRSTYMKAKPQDSKTLQPFLFVCLHCNTVVVCKSLLIAQVDVVWSRLVPRLYLRDRTQTDYSVHEHFGALSD